MKLIIQIPCFNEEKHCPSLSSIKRDYVGISDVKVLIIDDGSTDRTVQVAIANGVDYIVRHKKNRGLVNAFATGIQACMCLGADIVVNTDADNQYDSRCIQDLLDPIIFNRAEIVVHPTDRFNQ